MKTVIRIMIFLVLTGALMATAIIGAINEAKASITAYNEGICANCGGEYHLSGAYRIRDSSYYIYTCEECGHSIETYRIMN